MLLLSPYFPISFLSLTHSAVWGAGACPYASVFILKSSLLLPAVKSCSLKVPQGGTCSKQQPPFPYTYPLLTSHLIVFRPCFPHLFPSSSLSPLFYFHVEQLPAVKAYAASPVTGTCTQLFMHNTHRRHTVTYTNWLTKCNEQCTDNKKKKSMFFLWLTQIIIVF